VREEEEHLRSLILQQQEGYEQQFKDFKEKTKESELTLEAEVMHRIPARWLL